MSTCVHKYEVVQAVRGGQWPQGCAAELREHVAACETCAEGARVTAAFLALRDGAMRMAAPQSAGLLWWKAQLRRRSALERLEKPGVAISTVTIVASVVVLLMVLATVWKRIDWSQMVSVLRPAGWSTWLTAAIAVMVCGFVVAVVVGISEERG